jgi:hypothetical protein
MKKCLILCFFLVPVYLFAQNNDHAKDVVSSDAIIKALYEVISGDPGSPRDWVRFKNLFAADARLIPTSKNKEGKTTYRVLTPADYEKMFSTRISTGFYERELSRVTDEYGAVVHIFSTYETKEKKDGPVTNRGINSIQLLKTEERYYVMNIFWSAESAGNLLPEKYLKK